jgi:hypothetical protein
MRQKRMSTIRKACLVVVINFFLLILLIITVEGLASIMLLTERAFFTDLIAERVHTQYDEEIGWINVPNLSIDDMYGRRSFITNSMSFRNDKDFSFSVPDNKVRVICTGDSFTMGYGVDNDDVWCAVLEDIDNRIEAVNLGQGGYGVDQAYLWYKRNSSKLEHDIHLFAFIAPDFDRMQSDAYLGYGKPFLVLQDNDLININKPAPKRSYRIPRLPVIQMAVNDLSAIRIFDRKSLRKDPSVVLEEKNIKNKATEKVVAKIFEDLQNINKAKNSTLVVVLLPRWADYTGKSADSWRQFLLAQAAKHDFLYIDLIDEFRKYPPQEVASLFDGHYSVKGNAFIANKLYKKMLSIPEVTSRFQDK